jgi:hypothetical protein
MGDYGFPEQFKEELIKRAEENSLLRAGLIKGQHYDVENELQAKINADPAFKAAFIT